MRTLNAFGVLALAAASVVMSQGVTASIAPTKPAPSGCSASYPGQFQITVVNTKKAKRDALQLTLNGGILKDSKGRTGYIASNYQFQFDAPPQAGSIYTAGFSVCSNGSLALGGSAIWYQCLSGGFYNLYDRWWAAQCSPIYINVIGAGAAVATPPGKVGGGVTYTAGRSNGQVIAPTATSAAAVIQISDGQIQATQTSAAISASQKGSASRTSGSEGASVTQKSDGQPVVASSSSITALVPQVSQSQSGTPSLSSKLVAAASSASRTSSSPAKATTNAANVLVGEGAAVAAGLAAAFALL